MYGICRITEALSLGHYEGPLFLSQQSIPDKTFLSWVGKGKDTHDLDI